MGTQLVAVKDEFSSSGRVQAFRDVLAPYRLPVEAWQAGLFSMLEQNKYLLDSCDLSSVLNSGMTIAVLGLRMDRATGQSCIIPFKGKAQPIVMVQGYTVVAARGGYTLQGRLVREGDDFKEVGGSDPRIEHVPRLGNKGKIIGTYAVARSRTLPVLFTPFLSIDEVIAVRDKSKGYQSAMENRKPHPWATDFEPMVIKTAKRRLAKDIPNDQLHTAAWLDQQHDLGRLAYLKPDGQPESEPEPIYPERQPNITDTVDLTEPATAGPVLAWVLPDGSSTKEAESAGQWASTIAAGLRKVTDDDKLKAALERNRATINEIMAVHPDEARVVMKVFNDRGVY